MMQPQHSVEPLVLAAGLGQRMGGAIKSLIDIDGIPAIVRVLRCIEDAGLRPPLVVLGRGHRAVRAVIDPTACRVVTNPAPERGLSTSLSIGIARVSDDAIGVLIFHADMPLIRPETVRSFVATLTNADRIAAPCAETKWGFPLYLHQATFPGVLASLHGDVGARDYIAAHPEMLRLVPVDDRGCFLDFDHPADLERHRKEIACSTSA